ncbi:MAG: hypothetical protein AB1585_09245 [Thermodesulfobacteriota bacterium]
MLHLMGRNPAFDILMANINEWVFMTLASDERFQGMKNQAKSYIALRDAYDKPFVVIFGERGVIPPDQNNWQWQVIAEARAELIQAGMATFPTFRRAAKALSKVQEYYAGLV